MTIILAVVFVFLTLSLGFLIVSYNGIVAQYLVIDQAWGNIDVTLNQRFNEIPQLISICEQYAQHEKSVFDRVIRARDSYLSHKSISKKISDGKEFEESLGKIFAIAEGYPNLRSSEQFNFIQKRLSDLESVLAGRREFLNSAITSYNTTISSFPEMIVAQLFGRRVLPLFKPGIEQTQMPTLKIL